jgi:hypothetical protein
MRKTMKGLWKHSESIEKLRLSPFQNNRKLRWNLKNIIHNLRTKVYTDSLQKIVTLILWAFQSFLGTYHEVGALCFPVVSMDFSSFLIFAFKLLTSFGQ